MSYSRWHGRGIVIWCDIHDRDEACSDRATLLSITDVGFKHKYYHESYSCYTIILSYDTINTMQYNSRYSPDDTRHLLLFTCTGDPNTTYKLPGMIHDRHRYNTGFWPLTLDVLDVSEQSTRTAIECPSPASCPPLASDPAPISGQHCSKISGIH